MSEEKTKQATVKTPDEPPVPKGFEKLVKSQKVDKGKNEIAMQIYDIDSVGIDTEELRETFVPNLGVVQFKALDYPEARAVYKECRAKGIVDTDLQGVAIIAKMMNKADGKTTYDKLVKKSLAEVTLLSQRLGNMVGFLPQNQAQTTSSDGSDKA